MILSFDELMAGFAQIARKMEHPRKATAKSKVKGSGQSVRSEPKLGLELEGCAAIICARYVERRRLGRGSDRLSPVEAAA